MQTSIVIFSHFKHNNVFSSTRMGLSFLKMFFFYILLRLRRMNSLCTSLFSCIFFTICLAFRLCLLDGNQVALCFFSSFLSCVMAMGCPSSYSQPRCSWVLWVAGQWICLFSSHGDWGHHVASMLSFQRITYCLITGCYWLFEYWCDLSVPKEKSIVAGARCESRVSYQDLYQRGRASEWKIKSLSFSIF